ncbi:MAG: hypothetical protein ABIP75_07690 [Pyrinomonadaceae bacterium]
MSNKSGSTPGTLRLLASVFFLFSLVTVLGAAQSVRDHLTEQETEAVRLNQELDKRTGVFIKAADRRLLVLTDPTGAAAKISKKDLELYGPLPTGTRAQLLTDLAGILDEAADKIDDVAERDEANPLLMKSLKKLAEAAARYLPQLKAIGDAAKDRDEITAASRAADSAQVIVDAAKRHG